MLLSISSKQISCSKYLVYFILMGFLFWALYPKIWHAIIDHKTGGIVESFTYTEYTGRRGTRTLYYPVVDYQVKGQAYTCYGSSLQHDELHVGDSVAVIYDPLNPGNGHIDSFLGFWAPHLTYIIPFALILTLTFTGVDSIPKNFVIRF